jgi:hydrogenase-4 component E
MGLIELAVAKALASSAVFLFITLLMMASAKRISTCIVLFSVQSAIMAAEILAVAYAGKSAESYAVAALVIVVKVVAIPYLLFRIVRNLKASQDVASSTTGAQSVFIMAALILLSFFAVAPYAKTLRLDEDMLAAAILMVSRKKALMQVMGLLVLENGILLAALTTTFGMPLVIEIGIFFDLLMGVFLMGLFVFRIRDTFEHLDVSKLRRLRG